MAVPRGEEVVERDVQTGETEAYAASQWQLMWWKFRKHHLAMAAGMVIVALYVVAVFCEFLAPYTLNHRQVAYAFAPPQRLQFVSDEGVHFWPFVYGIKGVRHPETLRKFYIEDRSQRYAVRLFVRGAPYRFWGLFETDVHLFGVDDGGTLFLLGTDHLGRDLLSRIIYGSRISLTIGLVGVTLSFVFGLVIGVVSGYYGGGSTISFNAGLRFLGRFRLFRCGWHWPRRCLRRGRPCRFIWALRLCCPLLGGRVWRGRCAGKFCRCAKRILQLLRCLPARVAGGL